MSQISLHHWREPLSARTLALAFLSTSGARPMRAAALARRAEICGVDGAAMRMALGRLVRDEMVEQVERGVYAIGREGLALNRVARGWAEAESRVRAWDGRWIVVAVDHLGRSDRRQVRAQERALRLNGLARAESGLWVRPDNLALSLEDFAARLVGLGLDETATILGDVRALATQEAAFRGLWPAAAIAARYRHWIDEMAASEDRLAAMTTVEAARETLLLGQSVIRTINTDPLLPAEMVDAALRAEMIAAMRRYDTIGKSFWATVE